MENVERRLCTVVARHFDVPTDCIKLETKLVTDLAADSLDLVELTMAIEDEFEVSLDDEAFSRGATVEDAIKLVVAAPQDNRLC